MTPQGDMVNRCKAIRCGGSQFGELAGRSGWLRVHDEKNVNESRLERLLDVV